MALRLTWGTREWLYVTVTVEGATLDAQPVSVRLTPHWQPPGGWVPAGWVGDPGPTREARVLLGPGDDLDPPPGTYLVAARVLDDPEQPILIAGTLEVTD
jgi:hypothetical protein